MWCGGVRQNFDVCVCMRVCTCMHVLFLLCLCNVNQQCTWLFPFCGIQFCDFCWKQRDYEAWTGARENIEVCMKTVNRWVDDSGGECALWRKRTHTGWIGKLRMLWLSREYVKDSRSFCHMCVIWWCYYYLPHVCIVASISLMSEFRISFSQHCLWYSVIEQFSHCSADVRCTGYNMMIMHAQCP